MKVSKKEWLEDRLSWLLRDLGRTPAAVARNLEKAGIKGACGEAFACPISRWAQQEFPGMELAAGNVSVAVFVDEKNAVEVPTPAAVGQFMDGFDDKLFENLIDRKEAKKPSC